MLAITECCARVAAPVEYPNSESQYGHQGTVELWVTIDAAGKVARIEVKTSSGYDSLDAAARDAANKGTYRAGTFEGRPITASLEVIDTFTLTGG